MINTLKHKGVLLIDDDIRNVFSITGLLEDKEMKVFSVETINEAKKILKNNSGIDIVFAEIKTPEMDRYQTIKEIRKLKKYESLPVIVMTAGEMSTEWQNCMASGASDCISKPVDPDQLLAFLKVWIK